VQEDKLTHNTVCSFQHCSFFCLLWLCNVTFLITTNNNNVQVSAVADEPVRCTANELQTKVDAQCDKRPNKLSWQCLRQSTLEL